VEDGELSLVFEAEGDNTVVASLDERQVSDYSSHRREVAFYKPQHYRSSPQIEEENA